eukprot:scaffold4204_cov329-Prasinococcus_capsulatus_cf.AAC.4
MHVCGTAPTSHISRSKESAAGHLCLQQLPMCTRMCPTLEHTHCRGRPLVEYALVQARLSRL